MRAAIPRGDFAALRSVPVDMPLHAARLMDAAASQLVVAAPPAAYERRARFGLR